MVLLEILNIPLSWTGVFNGSTLVAIIVFAYNVRKGVKAKATKDELKEYIEKHDIEHKQVVKKPEIEALKVLINRNYEATTELNKDIKSLLKDN